MLLALPAVALSLVVAAWITNSDLFGLASAALPANTARADRNLSFADRFSPEPQAASFAERAALPMNSSGLTMGQMRISPAPEPLPPRLASQDLRTGFADSEAPAVATRLLSPGGIPLPRSRPSVADLEARPGSALALAQPGLGQTESRPSDRSLLQKFSDLLPGRLTLASLAPDGGLLFHRGPDLAALGYDGLTAVYDISAQAVYLPNGTVLEAHSGMGSLRDDPEHVSVANYGATPPATYDLKPREKEFHGVQALRMTPADGNDIFGRSGLLTHSYMLGPKGDSNGCVSVRDYDRFLKAFNDGVFNRLVVIPSLKNGANGAVASQSPPSRS